MSPPGCLGAGTCLGSPGSREGWEKEGGVTQLQYKAFTDFFSVFYISSKEDNASL